MTPEDDPKPKLAIDFIEAVNRMHIFDPDSVVQWTVNIHNTTTHPYRLVGQTKFIETDGVRHIKEDGS